MKSVQFDGEGKEMTTDQAVARQAAHENLVQELVEALSGLMGVAESSLDYRPEFRAAISRAHSTLARAEGKQ